MLYTFCGVNYYANLLIKPTAAQLHLYTLQHVLATTIWPSSEKMFFLDKAAYGTLVRINICICNRCHMLKVYVKIVAGIRKKQLKSIKLCHKTSCRQYVGRTQTILVVYIASANSVQSFTCDIHSKH
jgi:hypothetical protein